MTAKAIHVLPYNPAWPQMFEAEAALIKQALGENCIEIHHIGSTAVPGLAAKPIIDIIPVVRDITDVDIKTPFMEQLGYVAKGEYGMPFRRYFSKGQGLSTHNVHVFEEGNPEIELNLLFRDYLRAHLEARDEYATLKETLLQDKMSFQKINSNFTGYNLGKAAFIQKILNHAGLTRTRMAKCTHYAEWDAAKRFRQQEFFGKAGIQDPYTWTFDHPDHVHFVLYQGTTIVGYAHVLLWPEARAALRIIVIDESVRNQGLGSQFLKLIERWLKSQGRTVLQTESSPAALAFYQAHAYEPMPFNDPDGYVGDPQDTPLGKWLL